MLKLTIVNLSVLELDKKRFTLDLFLLNINKIQSKSKTISLKGTSGFVVEYIVSYLSADNYLFFKMTSGSIHNLADSKLIIIYVSR